MQEARLRRYLLLDAINEFHDELDHNARRLASELRTGLLSGTLHPADAWAKNRHLLTHEGLNEERELARAAYELTDAINRSMQERAEAADQNDPTWRILREEERREREQALAAVSNARDAFASAQSTWAITSRKITVKDG